MIRLSSRNSSKSLAASPARVLGCARRRLPLMRSGSCATSTIRAVGSNRPDPDVVRARRERPDPRLVDHLPVRRRRRRIGHRAAGKRIVEREPQRYAARTGPRRRRVRRPRPGSRCPRMVTSWPSIRSVGGPVSDGAGVAEHLERGDAARARATALVDGGSAARRSRAGSTTSDRPAAFTWTLPATARRGRRPAAASTRDTPAHRAAGAPCRSPRCGGWPGWSWRRPAARRSTKMAGRPRDTRARGSPARRAVGSGPRIAPPQAVESGDGEPEEDPVAERRRSPPAARRCP